MSLRLASAALLAGLVPAAAQTVPPDALVRSLYRAYEKSGAEPSATRLIQPHASERLGKLLARDEQCAEKRREPCAIDFDFIVNGQDFEIADVRIASPVVAADKATVTARFRNLGTPNEIVYTFVRERDAWRLDDIEARAPKNVRWILSKRLAAGGG